MLKNQTADNDHDASATIYSELYGAAFRMIKKDLLDRADGVVEGVFLHVMPLLMLTEYQSDHFFWVELRKMISADIYLDGKKLDLNLRLARPYRNRMFLALMENDNASGIYIPISVGGQYELCVEWRTCFNDENKQDERITHTQKIVIPSSGFDSESLTVYSVPETSYTNCLAGRSPTSLKAYACSDLVVSKQRADVFATSVTRSDNHLFISETINISHPLDLKSAAFSNLFHNSFE